MFYQTDSVKTNYFTVKDYDGAFLPEMVDKAPESASYTELTEVIISAARITSTEKDWYHLSPEFHIAVDVHDVHGLIGDINNVKFFHIVYMLNHVYDAQSKKFLHSEPSVVHAGAFTENKENDAPSEYSGLFYVCCDNSELMFDSTFDDYDTDYIQNHPEINKDYVIFVSYNVFTFESMDNTSLSGNTIFNGRYSETLTDNKTCHFLALDGIEDVLKGNRLTFTFIKGYYGYDNDGWFSATDYLYNDIDIVY